MYKFKNFSESANRSIASAIDIAQKMGHITVGSEHILLGILSQGKMDAADLLNENKITFTQLYTVVAAVLGTGKPTVLSYEDLSINSVNILKSATISSQNSFKTCVDVNEILMAIIKHENCMGYHILNTYIADIQNFKQQVENLCCKLSDVQLQNLKKTEDVKKEFKILEKFSKNLTEQARKNLFDPCIARDEEINRVIEILMRRQKNNPCLVGFAGVGKTAIVEGVANMIAQKTAPKEMWNKDIYSLDVTQILAGTKYRGDFEERIKTIIDEVSDNRDVILFIDEIHVITSAGAAEGAIDAANILKPALARGKVQVIGATTQQEYNKIIEKDTALERRFSKIIVNEPDSETAIKILSGLKENYERHHHITIDEKAIKSAVMLSQRYIQGRFLPDKAVDLLDEACSKSKMSGVKIVTEAAVAKVVSIQTKIPVEDISENEKINLYALENQLSEHIIGQPKAVKAVANAMKRWRIGLQEESRPIASFLFLGPTGVGKTQTCKELSRCLFHSEKALVRIDCSEYGEKNDITKLIGAPPGYIGYDDGGKLEKELLTKPYSVVLFDEIEKAHPDFCNLLLQILEDGFITNSSGKVISFRNTVIIMTSNIGAQSLLSKSCDIGFTTQRATENLRVQKKLQEAVRERFSPEFIGRIDEIITFDMLSRQDIEKITQIMLDELKKRLKNLNINVEYSQQLLKHICDSGYSENYGARYIRGRITHVVENFLSDEIFNGKIKPNDSVIIDVMDENLYVKYS